MKQMILKIDDDADFDLMDEELQETIKQSKISWPQGQMIGTKSYYNKRLVLILSPIEPEAILSLCDEFDLNWSILAVEGEKIDQAPLLGFMSDLPVFDDGEQIGVKEVLDLTGKLQTFAGRNWNY